MALTIQLLVLLAPALAAAQSLPLEVNDPLDGAKLNDASPGFAGKTAADAAVTITIAETVFGATADPTGNWTATLPVALPDGPYTATVVAADGTDTSPEVAVRFEIDTQPPALVIIEPIANSFVTATLVVRGNSDPEANVEVYVDDILIGTDVAASGGAWSVEMAEALGPGMHDVTVIAIDGAGNESELTIGIEAPTPPDLTDSDGDGLIDSIERAIGTDVDDPDTDGDGLSDFEEFDDHATNPRFADTDGDGIDDADEIAQNTDPRLADSDGGGVRDPLEIANGTNPRDAVDDFPAATDTSGHGCSSARGTPNGVWLLLALLAFKRRRRA